MSVARRRKVQLFLSVKEIFMVGLVVLSFVFLALEHLEALTVEQLKLIDRYEVIVGVTMLIEFAFEWYYSVDRSKYWRHHWFFLLAAIPIPTTTFEILRGIRLLRLLKLLKIFAEYRYERNTKLFS